MSRRILIVRTSAIGDIIFTTALLHGLRATWPDAFIGWLVDARFASILEGQPGIDRLHRFDRRLASRQLRGLRWGALTRDLWALRSDLRDARYDLALDAQGQLRSSALSWLSGARRRVVVRPQEGASLLATEAVPPRERTFPGDEFRDLLRVLGARHDLASAPVRLAIPAQAQAAAEELLSAHGLDAGGFAALMPFTTRPQKHWFEDRWVEVAGALRARGLRAVILGGPDESAAGQALAARIEGAVSFAGKTSILAAGGVLARASVAVGVDTGLVHLAMGNGTPTVALMGSALPFVQATPGSKVVLERLPCSPCNTHPTCGGRFDCMKALTVARVMDAVDEVRRN